MWWITWDIVRSEELGVRNFSASRMQKQTCLVMLRRCLKSWAKRIIRNFCARWAQKPNLFGLCRTDAKNHEGKARIISARAECRNKLVWLCRTDAWNHERSYLKKKVMLPKTVGGILKKERKISWIFILWFNYFLLFLLSLFLKYKYQKKSQPHGWDFFMRIVLKIIFLLSTSREFQQATILLWLVLVLEQVQVLELVLQL